jgi:hypothetical protein
MCPHATIYVSSHYHIVLLEAQAALVAFFFPLCEQAKAEVHEIQKEFQQEREDLLETVREQVCTVVKLALLLYYCSSKASMQV